MERICTHAYLLKTYHKGRSLNREKECLNSPETIYIRMRICYKHTTRVEVYIKLKNSEQPATDFVRMRIC